MAAASSSPGGRVDAAQANIYAASQAIPAQRKWAEVAKKCVDFLEGRQWDDDERHQREAKRRPTFTLNKIRPLMRIVQGYFTNNRQQIAYRPGNDFASSDDVADVLTKLVSNINGRCGLDFLQAEVLLDGVTTGRGWYDARVDISENMLGEIRVTSRDPFSVYPDPECGEYDPAKWGFVIETRWCSLVDVMQAYGAASAAKAKDLAMGVKEAGAFAGDLEWYGLTIQPDTFYGLFSDLQRADSQMVSGYANDVPAVDLVDKGRQLVRVIDRQHRITETGLEFVDLVQGQVKAVPVTWDRNKVAAVVQWCQQAGVAAGYGPEWIQVRRGPVSRWHRTVTAGDVVLHHSVSPVNRCTLVPYFPYFRRGVTQGLVSDLLDPQTELNRRRSAMAEILAKMANGGRFYDRTRMDPEDIANLNEFGSSPGVNIGTKGPPQEIIHEVAPKPLPAGHAEMERLATQDLKEISNITDAVLGQEDNADSGRAIALRQRQGTVALASVVDNMTRSLILLGRLEHATIQAIYTQERIFRERGDDGVDQPYVINRRAADGAIINDVTSGTYDVAIDTMPASAIADDVEFDTMMEMRDKGIPIPTDMLIQTAPIRRKREIIDRIRAAEAAQNAIAAAEAGPPGPGGPQAPVVGPPAMAAPPGNVVPFPAAAPGAPGA